jgi:hypothetical protein
MYAGSSLWDGREGPSASDLKTVQQGGVEMKHPDASQNPNQFEKFDRLFRGFHIRSVTWIIALVCGCPLFGQFGQLPLSIGVEAASPFLQRQGLGRTTVVQ